MTLRLLHPASEPSGDRAPHDAVWVIDGDLSPTAAAAAVEEHLRAQGMDDWALHELDIPSMLRRAWWGGDELGFVGHDHPQAQQVVVVHLPMTVSP